MGKNTGMTVADMPEVIKNWQFELEEYIKQGEPDRAEKSEAWQTAIGFAGGGRAEHLCLSAGYR